MRLFEGYFNNTLTQEIDADEFNQDSNGNTEDIESLHNYQYRIYIKFDCAYDESTKDSFEVIRHRMSAYFNMIPLVFEQSEPALLTRDRETLEFVPCKKDDTHIFVMIGFNAKFNTSKIITMFIYKLLPIVCKNYDKELKVNYVACSKFVKGVTVPGDYESVECLFVYEHIISHFINPGIKNQMFRCFNYFGLPWLKKNLVPLYSITNSPVSKRICQSYENDCPYGYKFLIVTGLPHTLFVVDRLTERLFCLIGQKPNFYSETDFVISTIPNGFSDLLKLYNYFIDKKNVLADVLLMIYKRGKKFTLIGVVTFSEGYATNEYQYYTPTIEHKYESSNRENMQQLKIWWMYRVLAPVFYAGNSVESVMDALWDIIKYDLTDYTKQSAIKEMKECLERWN